MLMDFFLVGFDVDGYYHGLHAVGIEPVCNNYRPCGSYDQSLQMAGMRKTEPQFVYGGLLWPMDPMYVT